MKIKNNDIYGNSKDTAIYDPVDKIDVSEDMNKGMGYENSNNYIDNNSLEKLIILLHEKGILSDEEVYKNFVNNFLWKEV